MSCAYENCSNRCIWKPVLELRSKKTGPVTKLKFKTVAYCEDHKGAVTVTTVLSDEAFVKIVKFMKESGKVAPVQRVTTISFERLTAKEEQDLNSDCDQSKSSDSKLPF